MENSLIIRLKEIVKIMNDIKEQQNLEKFYIEKNRLKDTINFMDKELCAFKKEINSFIFMEKQKFNQEIERKKRYLLEEIQNMINIYHNETLLEKEPNIAVRIYNDFLITYNILPGNHTRDYTFRYALCTGINEFIFPLKNEFGDIHRSKYAIMKIDHAIDTYNKFSEYIYFCKNC